MVNFSRFRRKSSSGSHQTQQSSSVSSPFWSRSSSNTSETNRSRENSATSLTSHGRKDSIVVVDNDSLWKTSVRELSPEEQEATDSLLGEEGSQRGLEYLQDVLLRAEDLKQQCIDKRWKYTNKDGEKIVLRDVMDKVIVWVDKFRQIGDLAVQYDPVHAALPWAGVRFLLMVAVNDSQRSSTVLEGLEIVSNLIGRYAIFEDLYLRNELFATKQLKHALIKLYSAVLRFIAKTIRYYKSNTMAKSVVQVSDGDIRSRLDAILIEQANVDNYAKLIDAAYSRLSYENSNVSIAGASAAQERLLGLLGDLQQPITRVSLQLSEIHDSFQAAERRKILDWISLIPYEQHHENVRRTRLSETGMWLFQKEEFDHWRKSSASSILWLHGIPGSGKTNLASLVIDDCLRGHLKGGYHEPLAYFYCARNTAERERGNPEEIFRSLVRQLSCLKPGMPIMPPIAARYKERQERNFGLTNLSLEECVEAIVEFTKLYPATTLILDALDECDPVTRPIILEKLDEIIDRSVNLFKVFVTSREEAEFANRLGSSPNLYIHAKENAKDIKHFVETEVQAAIVNHRLLGGQVSPELKERVICRLIDGAQGMFRWVTLQLQNLCNPRRMKVESDVWRCLEQLPEKLADIYAEIYQQITESGPQARLIAEKALRILICCQRRMSTAEFLAAVAIDLPDASTLELPEKVTDISTKDILDICCNLVVLDTGLDAFRFAHLSAREYLETRDEYRSSKCHAAGAAVCLYLFISFGEYIEVTDEFRKKREAFHYYASLYWPVHYQQAAEQRSEGNLPEFFQDFFWPYGEDISGFDRWAEHVRPRWKKLQYGSPIKTKLKPTLADPSNPIFLACAFGFGEILASSSGPAPDLEVRNDFGESPLYVASAWGHAEIAGVLVSKGARIDSVGGECGNALQAAAHGNQGHLVTLLLDNGANVNAINGYYGSALQAASAQGYQDIVKALLRRGADVNLRGGYYGSALMAAGANGHSIIVKLLVAARADLSIEGGKYHTPLQAAVWGGNERAVKLLLDKNANAQKTGGEFDSALQMSAFRGHEAVTTLLLDRGAEINEIGGKYDTPLLAAVWKGNRAVAELLLDRGAEINAICPNYGNALHAAVRANVDAMTMLLLERGADVKLEGGLYGNALQAAAEAGNLDIMKQLVDRGADVNKEGGLFGNALQAASERGHVEIIRYLLDQGAHINCETGVRGSALQAAAWGGNELVIRILLDRGADVTAATGQYGNALQMGALRAKEPVVQMLLSYIDVNAVGGKFGTALQAAGWSDDVDMVHLLLKNGADVNKQSGLYCTALQACAAAGNESAVQLLLDCGANADIQGGYYGSALNAAIEQGHEIVVELLRSRIGVTPVLSDPHLEELMIAN